jgi:hypothetical protein
MSDFQSDPGWHMLADYTFPGDEESPHQSDQQVMILLGEILASLGLPSALLQAISTRLIQAVTHGRRISPPTPVSLRTYVQKPDEPASYPGSNGWGHFLVERRVDRPGITEERSAYLIEIYFYSEGKTQ